MGLVGQLYYNVININEGSVLSSSTANIYNNLVGRNSAIPGEITKLGIQAEPGTRVELGINSNSSNAVIMMGQSGMFELDSEGVTIGFLKFIRPASYVLNSEETQATLNKGLRTMVIADKFKQKRLLLRTDSTISLGSLGIPSGNLDAQGKPYIDPTVYDEMGRLQTALPSTTPIYDKANRYYTKYWNTFQDIQDQYLRFYNIGLGLYKKGTLGVYVESPESQSHNDLYNVIIDYVYTPATQGGDK